MKEKYTIENLQKVAESRGGKCLAVSCRSSTEKLLWGCKEKHQWYSNSSNILQGNWCKLCFFENLRIVGEEKLKVMLKQRGGELISPKYLNNAKIHRFRCKLGHEWSTRASCVLEGKWCIECYIQGNKTSYEEICRGYFEQLFNSIFIKTRPEWLINPKTGNRLELDGFSKELKLAFEHQGEQHYVELGWAENRLETIKANDKIKAEICATLGITLIMIPELVSKTKIENLRNFIKEEIAKTRPELICEDFDTRFIDLSSVYTPSDLLKMQKLAKEKGGLCLSPAYLGTRYKLKWRCREGHEWSSAPNTIIKHWCRKCHGTAKLDIEVMKDIAKSRNGEFVSETYINSTTIYLWKCEKGHTWKSNYNNIYHGNWCPGCSKQRSKTIVDMQELALKFGGKCLSETFIDRMTPLTWECEKGHIWQDKYRYVLNGSWCKICKKIIKTDSNINCCQFLVLLFELY